MATRSIAPPAGSLIGPSPTHWTTNDPSCTQRPEGMVPQTPPPSNPTILPAAPSIRLESERIGRLLGAAQNALMWIDGLLKREEFSDSDMLIADVQALREAIYDVMYATPQEKVYAHIEALKRAHENPRLIKALENVLNQSLEVTSNGD